MTLPTLTLVKPDWGIVGGAERVLDRLAAVLLEGGFDLRWRRVDVTGIGPADLPGGVSPEIWRRAREYFTYLGVVDRCRRVDARDADLLVSTLPGSQAARGRRHLNLFFHHYRAFYDLAELLVRGGFVDEAVHEACVAAVRRVDAELFAGVDWFLTNSDETRRRLDVFSGIVRSSTLWVPGVSGAVAGPREVPDPGDEVLCVSRHEFPKRTELFVQSAAWHRLPSVVIGDGGRLGWVQELARRWFSGTSEPDEPATATWLRPVPERFVREGRPGHIGVIDFRGRVDESELAARYRRALCVVAPAYREDYGLTVLEAMHHGRPVIVCTDGGGLVDFIDDGVEGLVVEPHPRAIAEAVRRLADDRVMAAAMGRAGRARAASYTWARAAGDLTRTVRALLEDAPLTDLAAGPMSSAGETAR